VFSKLLKVDFALSYFWRTKKFVCELRFELLKVLPIRAIGFKNEIKQ